MKTKLILLTALATMLPAMALAQNTMRITYKDGTIQNVDITRVDSIIFVDMEPKPQDASITGDWMWGGLREGYYEVISFSTGRTFTAEDCYFAYGYTNHTYGTYTYSDMDELIDVCVRHMVIENVTEAQARAYMKRLLPQLDYWKRYEALSDGGQFEAFKQQLIGEINDLRIEGMPRVEKLNALVGSYVNLSYRLPSGLQVKFLDDQTTYLGNQLESELGGERCFGVLANMEFILVCTYGPEGVDPELVLYKKR